MVRKNRNGDTSCGFYSEFELTNHLFFTCHTTKSLWGAVAKCFNSKNVFGNLNQCWLWLECNLNDAKDIGIVGVSAICWALWKPRNNVCFENIVIKSLVENVCHARALILNWAGLSKKELQDLLHDGVKLLLTAANARNDLQELQGSRSSSVDRWMLVGGRLRFLGVLALLALCLHYALHLVL